MNRRTRTWAAAAVPVGLVAIFGAGTMLLRASPVAVPLAPFAPQVAAPSTEAGAEVFQTRCAVCHGQGGVGARAVSLADSGRLRAMSDADLRNIIRAGTPNGMPGFAGLAAADFEQVVQFIRSISPAAAVADLPGDAVAGEAFFFGRGGCASCHMVNGRGAWRGPDLSAVGQRLSVAELAKSLREPAAAIAQGYAQVRVDLPGGRTLRGYPRNEGNHSLPLQTLDGRLVALPKRGATVVRETGSVMPALAAAADEQQNLLAFLNRLRGGDAPPAPAAAGATVLTRTADFDEILTPKPGDWPTYHGRLDGNRFSRHAQITAANVSRLALQWSHSLRGFDNGVTPIVLDGIMYITGPNQVSALDARSGREIWRYSRPLTPGLEGDAARGVNRGVAVVGPRVFFVTDNAHLIGLNRVNGSLLWDVVMPENTTLPYGGTMAPLVVGNLVIAGVSGGDGGIRGFLAAYHVETGAQAWRFWTVPTRSDPEASTWVGPMNLEWAGGATWLTGTYDPQSETLYWPTGNPYPDTDGSLRGGDNLYTNCILALDVKTGKLRWYFQFTPHDLWDWDAQQPPLLVDAAFQGAPRQLLLQANRNGFFYVLDCTTGKLLLAEPFVMSQTWASRIGADGRPVLLPSIVPDPAGTNVCPAIRGAANWPATSYSPATGFFYVVATENCGVYRSTQFGGGPQGRVAVDAGVATPAARANGPRDGPANRRPASPFGIAGGGFNPGGPGGGGTQALRAIEIGTGRIAWEVPQIGNSNNYTGTLATAGGVVFYGQASGEFAAVDAATGAPLWYFETQENWKASSMTYVLDGRQYVAVTSGANVLAFALPDGTAPPITP